MLQRGVLAGRLAVVQRRPVPSVAGLLAGCCAQFPLPRAGRHLHALVLPGGGVIGLLLGVPARKQTVQILGVQDTIVDDHRRIGVLEQVLPEVPAVLEDVMDDASQERQIAAGAELDVGARDRARAGEARVDVDHLGAAPLCLHHPLEADRMALGHVGAHDQDAVNVLQILLERRGPTSSERCPQTGNGGRVSYARLVLDLDEPERGHQLLDRVVLLVVERGTAAVDNTQGPAQGAVLRVDLLPRAATRLYHAVGDHVHRLVQSQLLPVRAVGRAVLDPVLAQLAGDEVLGGRALRTQAAARDRAVRIALDLGDGAVLDVHLLAAADRAVGADRVDHAGCLRRARAQLARRLRLCRPAARKRIAPQLPDQRPVTGCAQRVRGLHAPATPAVAKLGRTDSAYVSRKRPGPARPAAPARDRSRPRCTRAGARYAPADPGHTGSTRRRSPRRPAPWPLRSARAAAAPD